MIVVLDSGILALLSRPNKLGESGACENWLYQLLSTGVYVVTSELCDYEVRREVIRASRLTGNTQGIQNLNQLRALVDFLPITTTLLKQAAELWADAREQGIPTADAKDIDVDMILCAQWRLSSEAAPGRAVVIATTNVKHLSRFANADTWQNI